MPRTYVPNRTRRSRPVFTAEYIRSAALRVINGEQAFKVANDTGIPRTTIRRKVQILRRDPEACIESNFKKSQVFTPDQEIQICEYLETCSAMFYGLTTTKARELAYQTALYNDLKRPKQWDRNQKAGIDWLYNFMRRHPRLSIRKPEPTSIARASSFNKKNIGEFFDKLEEVLEKFEFTGKQIYNLDETGFTTVQKMPKVISKRGSRVVGQIASRERGELVTACCIVSAVGQTIPPVFLFPRKKFNVNMMNNAPEGSIGFSTGNGWMNIETFIHVLKHFKDHARPTPQYPLLLIMDNHETHLSLPALSFAKESNIQILTLVPHTSHKTQPLDRGVFGPMKKFYNAAATSWMMRNPGRCITIQNIPELVCEAVLKGSTPANIQSGVKATGIWPYDRFIFGDEDFVPASVTNSAQSFEEVPQTSKLSVPTPEAIEARLAPPQMSTFSA